MTREWANVAVWIPGYLATERSARHVTARDVRGFRTLERDHIIQHIE